MVTMHTPVVAPECMEWMRARRKAAVSVTTSDGQNWTPEYTDYVSLLDIPRWRVGEKSEEA
jgi:hypothetical protein